jgi:hypothetical protein
MMNIKTSVGNFVENVTQLTLNNIIKWEHTRPTSVRLKNEEMTLEYTISWSLKLETGWIMSDGWLSVKTGKIDLTIYKSDYPEYMTKLKEYFFEHFFKSTKPDDQEVVDHFIELTKKTSLEDYRNKNIEKILE